MVPSGGWLTVNRFCNFRCSWCYAESTQYLKKDDMSFELAKELINFSSDIGMNDLIIIGGEPTFHKDIFNIIKYINSKNIFPTLVTNGYLLSEKSYIQDLIKSGIGYIIFSIKASDKETYKELVGIDAYDTIVKAIKNLSKVNDVPVSYSFTVTNENIDYIEDIARLAAIGENHIYFSFCKTTFDKDNHPDSSYIPDLKTIVNKFVEKYERINEITSGLFTLEQSLPKCIWPQNFLEMLKQNDQIQSKCHVFERKGLIFDTDGSILPCNCLSNFQLGTYGIDFKTKEEFEKYWNSDKLIEMHNKLISCPDVKCISCDDYSDCGGGCPLKWFALNP